jgi:hypothetical protein
MSYYFPAHGVTIWNRRLKVISIKLSFSIKKTAALFYKAAAGIIGAAAHEKNVFRTECRLLPIRLITLSVMDIVLAGYPRINFI